VTILLRFLPYIIGASVVFGLYLWVDGRGYDRGHAARDAEARKVIAQMEKRRNERIQKNEELPDKDLDCALIRFKNPKAECPTSTGDR
jgi:hypothetical protein